MVNLHHNKVRAIVYAMLFILLFSSPLFSTDGVSGDDKSTLLNPPEQAWFPKAPVLRRADGPAVEVSDVQELIRAIEQAEPGQTILLADGHYMMPRYVQIAADNVTLRGASGRREWVIIDGAKSRHGELLGITACSGVTIADLTIQNIRFNGFKINSQTNVQRLTIYNCIIHNIWQRGVKGVKVPEENRQAVRPKQCRIQYCLFYNDRPKRLSDDEGDIADGNYVAGIDVMYAKDWVISDNVFVGIQGRTYEGRGAVFMWHDSEDCLIERNIIIDCDVGLQLGNPHRAEGTQYHCVRFIARNNFITRAPEAGIVIVYTKDCKILNNTIHDPQSRLQRLIRTVFTNDGLLIANNLISGPGIRNESDSVVELSNNLIKDLTNAFVEPERGNLHLTHAATEAIDRGIALEEVSDDIDRQPRRAKPDIGADEIIVRNTLELRRAITNAKPGTTIALEPGVYEGGIYLSGISGADKAPITIEAADPNDPPVFSGGGQAMHLSDCNYIILRNLKVKGFPSNGINIDDGGSYETPAHHITLENLTILETGPKGNHDALKMSGVDHFVVRGCHFEGWGGSGIDMVGCHHGIVEDCTFVGREGFEQSNAVQLKGGTEYILVQTSLFRHAGQRSINLGGSTGLQFFRPEVGDYEARNITIAGNRFVGSVAPIAWVTADGGHVHHNTIVLPQKWILRILQETEDSKFKPCHAGIFENNLIIFDSRVDVFVNVGSGTAPETFVFRHNAWHDLSSGRKPSLPTAESDAIYQVNLDTGQDVLNDGRIRLSGEQLKDIGSEGYKRN
ncbi:MAG: right-handed parallel beta-helix repeat-containing protein [Planctomycetota bacterium]